MRILRPRIHRRQGGAVIFPQPHAVGGLRAWEPEAATPKLGSYNDEVEFTLRDFRREDFETLWRIDQECFPPGISYSRLELAAYIRRWRSFTLVAESADVDGNGISGPARRNTKPSSITLGFIVAEASRRGVGHIITIDVLPAAQRLGVGAKLLNAAEDRLRTAGSRSVSLETAVDNQVALAFYKKHGYSLTKTIPRYYSNGVDALVLSKQLV
jgi:[ribosomal protein S18]-alanine N-acetyltransferase